VHGAATLTEIIHFVEKLRGPARSRIARETLFRTASTYGEGYTDMEGQEHVERGLDMAKAGSHNVLMVGPPGLVERPCYSGGFRYSLSAHL
jgi:magnesium chelatase family protein